MYVPAARFSVVNDALPFAFRLTGFCVESATFVPFIKDMFPVGVPLVDAMEASNDVLEPSGT